MSWKKIAWRLLMAAVLILVALETYNRTPATFDWSQVLTHKPAALPLVASVVLLMVANVLHAVLWRKMSVDLGSPAPNARATLHIYFVSSLSRYFVKLGQVAGLAVLATRFGMSAGRVTAAALVAELIKMATGFLLVGCTMPGITTRMHSRLPVSPGIIGLLMSVSIVAAIWMITATRMGHKMREVALRRVKGRTGERLTNAFTVLDDARPRDVFVWAAGYLFAWIIVGAAFVLFVDSFVPLHPSEFVFVGGISALSYLLGYFSLFPAGLGFREGFMIALLKLILPLEVAFTIGIMSRFWFTAGEILPLALIPLSGRNASVSPARPRTVGATR